MSAGDLWQQARRQVAEYEQRSSELQLTLAAERAALEAQERETKKLEEGERGWGRWEGAALEFARPWPSEACLPPPTAAERAAFAKRAHEAEARVAAAAAAAAELRTEVDKASTQHSLLQKHLEMLRGSLKDASTQMDADRKRYQQHLSQLRAALDAYERHLAERLGGAEEAAAAGAVAAAAGQAAA